MNTANFTLQELFTVCGLCHDQCVSACPIVEISHRQEAYASRLAALAWELSRGGVKADTETMQAMLHCIHCNACTERCVYIDHPIDVTPAVRWARETLVDQGQATAWMREIQERVQIWGNPYADVHEIFAQLKDQYSSEITTGGTLVIVDAGELAFGPSVTRSGLQLLRQAGYYQMTISEVNYTGWELWQYGYLKKALDIAKKIYAEIDARQPDTVITLSPVSTFLLRQAYPEALEIPSQPHIFTLPEAVLAKSTADGVIQSMRRNSVLLIPTTAEVYQLHSLAAQEVLSRMGISCQGFANHQPFQLQGFPEGWIPDLFPDAGLLIGKRIVRMIDTQPPDVIVCTSAFALKTLKDIGLEVPVIDWPSFVLANRAGSANGLSLGI